MKKFTLGQNLLIVYGVLILIFIFKTGFSIAYGFSWAAYPTWWLLRYTQSVITFFTSTLGFTGANILVSIVQGAILYYGGNWLGKTLKKS